MRHDKQRAQIYCDRLVDDNPGIKRIIHERDAAVNLEAILRGWEIFDLGSACAGGHYVDGLGYGDGSGRGFGDSPGHGLTAWPSLACCTVMSDPIPGYAPGQGTGSGYGFAEESGIERLYGQPTRVRARDDDGLTARELHIIDQRNRTFLPGSRHVAKGGLGK